MHACMHQHLPAPAPIMATAVFKCIFPDLLILFKSVFDGMQLRNGPPPPVPTPQPLTPSTSFDPARHNACMYYTTSFDYPARWLRSARELGVAIESGASSLACAGNATHKGICLLTSLSLSLLTLFSPPHHLLPSSSATASRSARSLALSFASSVLSSTSN